jgi:hypothetical protein
LGTFLSLGALLFILRAEAAVQVTTLTTWSRSSQFVITSPLKPGPAPLLDNPKNNPNLQDVVRLSAAGLATSCEQVKAALLLQLDASDHWKSRIRLNIMPGIPPQAGVLIDTRQYNDGVQNTWLYNLNLPEFIERRKLLRALVQVCLLEMGNRNNSGSSVDVPMWLREGLTEIMLYREGTTIIAEANPIQQRANSQFWLIKGGAQEKVWRDPLSLVREKLKATAPLSFSDLSVPVDDQIASLGLEHFQHCAHLFTSELIALPEGHDKLRHFVQDLARYSHPQFAFLNAFREQFASPLDVEKWWSLAQVAFLSREDHARWPEKDALGKLNEILQPQVQFRLGPDSLPIRETYTIKRLLEDVDFDQQRPILQQLIGRLQQLEWNLPPDLLKLVYDYRITLTTYLYKREQLSSSGKTTKAASTTAKPVIREALTQLGFLEILREDYARIGLSEKPVNSAQEQQPVTDFLKAAP